MEDISAVMLQFQNYKEYEKLFKKKLVSITENNLPDLNNQQKKTPLQLRD